MTVIEWLSLDDNLLGVELGKILTPGPWKHNVEPISSQHVKCNKCRKTICVTGQKWDFPNSQPCPIPDAIDINDWGLAKAEQAKCDGQAFYDTLRTVIAAEGEVGENAIYMGYWIVTHAQPKHYLIAAALAGKE